MTHTFTAEKHIATFTGKSIKACVVDMVAFAKANQIEEIEAWDNESDRSIGIRMGYWMMSYSDGRCKAGEICKLS